MNDATQYELNNTPHDGITQVRFHPTDPDILLVSSWDKTVRLYNVKENKLLNTFESEAAVLDCCFGEPGIIYYGGIDKKVKRVDINTQQQTIIGKHDAPISSLCWSTNKLYSGSWDKTLCVWDIPQLQQERQIQLNYKIYSMDLRNGLLAVAMSERKAVIYDTRDMSAPWQTKEIALRYMLKCIRLMPNGEGYACSSVEGRVAIEYFDLSEEKQAEKYAFKSHRQVINDTEVVYPVNSLSFHPKYGTFASGGSDSVVNIWDGVHRKRLRHIAGYPDEIASLCFNVDGTKLAIASSYTFDEGERDHAPDTIFIKPIHDSEVMPKIMT